MQHLGEEECDERTITPPTPTEKKQDLQLFIVLTVWFQNATETSGSTKEHCAIANAQLEPYEQIKPYCLLR